MRKNLTTSPEKSSHVTLRATLIGVVLIIVNAFWIYHMEIVRYSPETTTVALILNAVIWLIALIILNVFLQRFLPRHAFSQGELMVIYVMMAIGAVICGLEFIETLVHSIGHPVAYATPENDWANLFISHLPKWLIIHSERVVKDYYTGESTLYTAEHIRGIIIPVLTWGFFAFVLVSTLAVITVFFRSQWINAERLTYPIIQIPLEMTQDTSQFFKRRTMWTSFSIVLGFQIFNGLYFFFPQVPHVPIWYVDFGHLFQEKPWTAMGMTRISFYPFMIGLVYFSPLDLSLSAWFFFLVWKAELVIRYITGWAIPAGLAFNHQASGGAYLAICLLAIWASRKRLIQILKKVFVGNTELDENSEAIPFRLAILGVVFGLVFLIWFCYMGGMSLCVAFLFFALYGAVSICVTKLRAELGAPVHYYPEIGPSNLLYYSLGTRRLGAKNLGMMALLRWFSLANRNNPMPHQMEAFKIAERVGIDNTKLFAAIILAVGVAIAAGLWASLHTLFEFGAAKGRTYLGWITYGTLERWLVYPSGVNYTVMATVAQGFIVVLFLALMRSRFLWWSLHPVGYLMGNDHTMNYLWMPFLIGWLVKSIVLKYGGLRAYRKTIPVAVGVILGDFVSMTIWSVIGMILDAPTYSHFWHPIRR